MSNSIVILLNMEKNRAMVHRPILLDKLIYNLLVKQIHIKILEFRLPIL